VLWYLTSWRAETVEVLTQVALPDPLSEVVQVAERSLNAFLFDFEMVVFKMFVQYIFLRFYNVRYRVG